MWLVGGIPCLFPLSTDQKEINFRYVPVGSFSRNTNTWKWAWDNDDTKDASKSILSTVVYYGIKNDFEKLTTGYFPAEESNGWEFVPIAANLLGAIGAYRAVHGHLLIFAFVC